MRAPTRATTVARWLEDTSFPIFGTLKGEALKTVKEEGPGKAVDDSYKALELTDAELSQVDALARTVVSAHNTVTELQMSMVNPRIRESDQRMPDRFVHHIEQALEAAPSDGEREAMRAIIGARFFRADTDVDGKKVWELTDAGRFFSPEQADTLRKLAGLPEAPES